VNKIIFATKNKGKLKEVRHIFEGSSFEIISLTDLENIPEVIEDKETFEENALKKAVTIFEKFGVPVIADDSGLAVEQLNWEPGVYSARYAGENATDEMNNLKLLEELRNKPEPHKGKFICAAVYYDGTATIKAYGEVGGRIIKQERGSNGFGYDPLFIPDGFEKTSGELELSEKNKISHRAKAFRHLRNLLENKMERQ
jgi:XTP/dITP diphosphohydrolase